MNKSRVRDYSKISPFHTLEAQNGRKEKITQGNVGEYDVRGEGKESSNQCKMHEIEEKYHSPQK